MLTRRFEWLPASVPALRHYDTIAFRRDPVADLTAGMVALHLAMGACHCRGSSATRITLTLEAHDPMARSS
jgi:hypothetical protein